VGVLSGRDQLTSKYTTAEITDSDDRVHYVPIKHSIGDYFLADLDGKLFAFTLKGARVLTHYKTLTKSFRVIQYDTSHYSSLRPETKELELILKKNALPKMDRMLHDVLTVLGRREKQNFEHHSIEELVQIFDKKEGEFPEEVKKIKAYLEELNIKEIVTPVRKITEFIQGDLIATSPSYLGGLLLQYHRVDGELRKITNSPVKNTNNILKLAIIVLMGIVIVGGLYYAYDQGVFEGIGEFTDSIGNIGDGMSGLPSPMQGFVTLGDGDEYSDDALQAKYSPEELKLAVNSGELDYNKLSSNMKDMIEDVEIEDTKEEIEVVP
jgi:hypothetical protein